MKFFNFKLSEDSYAKEKIKIPKKLAEKLPEDYLDFLEHYNEIEPFKMNDKICIKINGDNISIVVMTYDWFQYIDDSFPKCYMKIADDFEFEGFILSLRKEDFGHVYYMDLEMWQEHILGLEDEKEIIESINKNSIHIANSFTEFAKKLYIIPDEDS